MTEAITALMDEGAAATDNATTQAETTTTTATDKTAVATTEQTTQAATTDTQESTTTTDDWRTQAAGGNEEYLKLLGRYGSITGVVKALHDTKLAISQGKFQKAKPADGDEKAMAEWRKEQGIPDDPAGYKLPDDVVKSLTDDDKPVLAQFTEFAHKKGMTSDAVAAATEWYVESQRASAEMQAETDKAHKSEAEDSLRDPVNGWSPAEYRGNMNLAKRFLDESPIGSMGWAGLRGPDGRLLGSNADFMKWASDQGRGMFGDADFANSDTTARHEGRLKEIQGILKTDRARYFREGLDKEFAELLQKEEKRKK